MAHLSISEVARQVGLRASAIRYYEQIGILPPTRRVSGQRRYDVSAVYRLAVVRRAQEVGFTLDEIRDLFVGFRESTPVSLRWRKIAEQKLTELETKMERIRSMKELLTNMQTQCRCETVNQCGAAIFRGSLQSGNARVALRNSRKAFE